MKTYQRNNKKNKPLADKEVRFPSNYYELFFDTIKQNWQTIIFIGLFSFLFFIIAIGFNFAKDYYLVLLVSSSMEEAEMDALRITSRNLFNIGVAFGIAFASIGVSGLSRINLLVSTEEGFYFFKDFNKGIKQNLKSNMVFFIIYAIIVYFSLLVINSTNLSYFRYIPFAFVQTIVFPILITNVETTSVYSWKLSDSFRNSSIIYIKNFLVLILFSILLSSVLLFNLIQYIFLKYILIALFVIFVYPFIILAMRVCFNRILDRDINKEHYPEIYKKGIYEPDINEGLASQNYYGSLSTYKSIEHDPVLSVYYYHLCSYVKNKDQLLMELDAPWPKKDIIDSLNYLRVLVMNRMTSILNKKDYSAVAYKQKEKAKVAIILAGGGYENVVTLPEGLPVAVALHKKGFTTFTINYPVSKSAKQSLNIVKSFIALLFRNETRMNIDMSDYIVIGFSAGAHLAGELASDNFGLQNDGLLLPKLFGLCYPVISFRNKLTQDVCCSLLGENPSQEEIDNYSLELHVTKEYPHVFIWQCENDKIVPSANSLAMVEALKNNGVDYRFEHFDDDGHGYVLGTDTVAAGWLDRFVEYYSSILDK